MAKTKISEYDSTAANNTDVDGVNIAESCPPSGINNAIREVMAHLKDFQSGVSGDKLPIASGGTNAGTASDARTNLGLGALAVKATVATADIDADAINGTKIADDSIDSEHYVDGSIDTAHIGDSQVTSAKIADNNVTADELNVSGNGTSGQVLSSDGDGSFSWTDGISGSLAATGYVEFGNGFKIQWGSGTLSGIGEKAVTFTSAYSNACVGVFMNSTAISTGNIIKSTNVTTSGFTAKIDYCCAPNVNAAFNYIAFGY